MNKEQALKETIEILRQTEKEIAELKEGKSLEKPVMNDIVKTKKAMAYESILYAIRKNKEK